MKTNTQCPSHYAVGKIEPWDFIRDQELNYHLGNAIKYICRANYKGSRRDDLRKAIHYLQNELENDILHPSAASRRIPEKFPGEEQYYASFTDIAEAFDR
jgi:hypothetical protein